MKPIAFLPKMEEALKDLKEGSVFSKLDMFAGYVQQRLAGHIREKTAFYCKYEIIQFIVIFFGLMNVPVRFPRMVEDLFGNIPHVKVFIGDAIVELKVRCSIPITLT